VIDSVFCNKSAETPFIYIKVYYIQSSFSFSSSTHKQLFFETNKPTSEERQETTLFNNMKTSINIIIIVDTKFTKKAQIGTNLMLMVNIMWVSVFVFTRRLLALRSGYVAFLLKWTWKEMRFS
jgi:hypothetical protein